MKKSTTGKASTGRSKSNNTSGYSLKRMEKKLTLMGYVRGKDWSRELIEELQTVERELATCQSMLKASSAESDEVMVMERLRELEIRRFQLLGQVHGNRVNDYQLLIS